MDGAVDGYLDAPQAMEAIKSAREAHIPLKASTRGLLAYIRETENRLPSATDDADDA